MSYRNGRVYLMDKQHYDVGLLPAGWEQISTKVRTITFYNADLGASISTDAFCGKSVEGRKLDSLGGEILGTLSGRKMISELNFELDGRGAVRQKVLGTLDGVPVLVDLVVLSKNGCIFDFYSVSPGGQDPATADAFDGFIEGFQYE